MIKNHKIIQTIFSCFRLILIPFIPVYLLVFYLKKAASKPEKQSIPVICVGNITTGGTGKTPFVIYLAKKLFEKGYKPGIISRGYGGKKSRIGAIVSDGKDILLSTEDSGDEPVLSAMKLKDIPIAIGSNRIKSVKTLKDKLNINIVIMDDGLQNNSIIKDISIVIIDAINPFGNGFILPSGNLREPKCSIKNSDIIIINKTNLVSNHELVSLQKIIRSLCKHDKIFLSEYIPNFIFKINNISNKKPVSELNNKKVLLIAGIANPESFNKIINLNTPDTINMISLPDHYQYRDNDIRAFTEESNNYDYVIVTEKDYVKMKNFIFNDKFFVLNISIKLENEALFLKQFDYLS